MRKQAKIPHNIGLNKTQVCQFFLQFLMSNQRKRRSQQGKIRKTGPVSVFNGSPRLFNRSMSLGGEITKMFQKKNDFSGKSVDTELTQTMAEKISEKSVRVALKCNEITSIHDSFFEHINLQHVRILVLSQNAIPEIPESIAVLTELRELNLSNNLLTSFPPALVALTSLKKLDISNNMIESVLTDTLQNLTALVKLNLSDNKLHSLPPSLLECTLLRKLRVHNNPLLMPPCFV
mgnify:CR=1 FL=1